LNDSTDTGYRPWPICELSETAFAHFGPFFLQPLKKAINNFYQLKLSIDRDSRWLSNLFYFPYEGNDWKADEKTPRSQFA
jgi:hypothetical protein